MVLDKKLFRQAMGRFATGVTVLTVNLHGAIKGMTANAVTSVSLEPLLMLACIGHTARTHSWMSQSGWYGVNILSGKQKLVSDFFARGQGDDPIPDSIKIYRSKQGTPIIEGSMVFFDCRVVQTVEAGDHTLFLGQIEDIQILNTDEPLLFSEGKYHALRPL